jgi:ubiquinol-cytochrome c reductase cytochrome b subunit
MKLGACHVESPYIELGQFSTALYFSYFIFIVPAVSLIESGLMDLSLVDLNNFIKRLQLTIKNKLNGIS